MYAVNPAQPNVKGTALRVGLSPLAPSRWEAAAPALGPASVDERTGQLFGQQFERAVQVGEALRPEDLLDP